ncbi:MAG: GNAT family N-acetyltransferase [Firmicutes bacterium]|nr:GNAT family N-acetyltransferase [Bacillota bacterium]
MEKQYQYYTCLDNKTYLKQIWDLLRKYNNEFIPPLSVRKHTDQAVLKELEVNESEPKAYYEELKKQAFILCIGEEDKVLGFMSLKENYKIKELQALIGNKRNSYVSTVIVDQESRGEGIAAGMYEYLENSLPEERTPDVISTRTWSTNDSHIKILKRRGFSEALRIHNDRGSGIDTVYYYKILKP